VESRAAYRDLDVRMRVLAEADRDIISFPNPEPSDRVDYVFICPGAVPWWPIPGKGEGDDHAGFRNFVNSLEDFRLHFSIRRYLCKSNERYYITDWSKGAMAVERASVDRSQRCDKWYRSYGRNLNTPKAHYPEQSK
jgi:hypothetical protein